MKLTATSLTSPKTSASGTRKNFSSLKVENQNKLKFSDLLPELVLKDGSIINWWSAPIPNRGPHGPWPRALDRNDRPRTSLASAVSERPNSVEEWASRGPPAHEGDQKPDPPVLHVAAEHCRESHQTRGRKLESLFWLIRWWCNKLFAVLGPHCRLSRSLLDRQGWIGVGRPLQRLLLLQIQPKREFPSRRFFVRR